VGVDGGGEEGMGVKDWGARDGGEREVARMRASGRRCCVPVLFHLFKVSIKRFPFPVKVETGNVTGNASSEVETCSQTRDHMRKWVRSPGCVPRARFEQSTRGAPR